MVDLKLNSKSKAMNLQLVLMMQMATNRPITPSRLRVGDITIEQVMRLSRIHYSQVDDKKKRYKQDVVSGRLVSRNNLTYNRSAGEWQQTGREMKFIFQVKTDPVSYTRRDSLRVHTYPVVFIIKNFELGIHSPFRWRTGTMKKPQFAKKGLPTEKRQKIQEDNIRRGIQMQFFFELSWVLKRYGLLFGPNYAAWPPRVVNPRLMPFFDKHALSILETILIPFLKRHKGSLLNRPMRNESRQ